MSEQFVGIKGKDDELFRQLIGTKGLTDKDKARINRRFTAEINNRDLYERAVDDRYKEMRKANISEPSKFKSESLEILLQYQKRKHLTLEELEAEVAREQVRLRPFVGPPAPTVKPVSEMTISEKQDELERIRELKRLAR